MKFSIIFLSYVCMQWCSAQAITAENFAWKLIENCLNVSKDTENFIISPYEAYQLYKELLNIEDESYEDDALESNNQQEEQLFGTMLPAIKKQLKTINKKQTNQTDMQSIISLTARWSFNFQTRDTHKRVFHQHGKTNQKMWVDFLRKDDTFHYNHDEQLNASILELPLNIKEIKLTIILPDQWHGLPQLKEYFLENLQDFQDLFLKTRSMTLVRVLLPKFHLTYKKDLTAYFEEISSQEMEKYDHVYQVSNLEFNERGIGRFERTTVLFWNAYSYLRVSPELFDISHPFLFFISDKHGIQFFGQVVAMQH